MNKEFEKIYSFRQKDEHRDAIAQIKSYFENSYGASVRDVILENGEDSVRSVYVLFTKNEDLFKVAPLQKTFALNKKDGQAIAEIFDKSGIEFTPKLRDGFFVFLRSFEYLALRDCYNNAFEAEKEFIKGKLDKDTMERIESFGFYVVYKSEAQLIAAEESGRNAKLKEEYFDFIKQFDTYGYINEGKLLADFTYVDIAPDSKAFYEKALEILLKP